MINIDVIFSDKIIINDMEKEKEWEQEWKKSGIFLKKIRIKS